MTKTPSVKYYTRKIRTYGRDELYEEIDNSPLNTRDYAFLADIVEGLTNRQLQEKYNKSASRISQWKRAVFEQMHAYDLHQAEKRYVSNRPRIDNDSMSNR